MGTTYMPRYVLPNITAGPGDMSAACYRPEKLAGSASDLRTTTALSLKSQRGNDVTQAIVTKYRPANEQKGSRIVASAAAGSRSYPRNYQWNDVENHRQAAIRFAELKQWSGRYVGGCLPTGDYVWVWDGPQGDGEFTIENRPGADAKQG